MNPYQITIHEDGCRVQATQTGMFVTQPLSFSEASRKAAALNTAPWHVETIPNDNDFGQLPIPVLNAEMLGLSGGIEATTPIRGVDWGDLVDRVMSFAVGIVLGVVGALLLIEWLR